MIKSKEIQLFQNLSQYEYDGKYYDFHNDYDCLRVLFENAEDLTLIFRHTSDDRRISIRFREVELYKIEFFNTPKVSNLIIDNLYRGRFEFQGHLEELTPLNKGYFYLEFDEGQKIEFWSSGLLVNCFE